MFSTTDQQGRIHAHDQARTRACKTLAAMAVSFCLANIAKASIVDVTSLQTNITQTISSSTLNDVSGNGNNKTFPAATSSYNIDYQGQDDEILSLQAGGVTYDAGSEATITVRRNTNASDQDNDVIWYQGTGAFPVQPIALYGPNITGYEQALGGNNLYVGADNLFTNKGDTANNDSNVARVDFIFKNGVPVNSSEAFSILERGTNNDHDAFKIAAVTSIDANGNPTGYGPLISFQDGAWGKTALNTPTEYITENRQDSSSTDPLHPANIEQNQYLGGVLIHTDDFGVSDQTIYGYSLFAPDVTDSGSKLLNWTNSTYFPTNTSNISTAGGLDPVDTMGVLYSSAAVVPEPATGLLAIGAATGLLARRRTSRRRA